jgi:hypothetical protein
MSIPQLSPLQLELGQFFLHTHRNAADRTIKDNLDSRELLLTSAGKEMDLPLTVSSCWTKMGAKEMTKRYLEAVVYCPNPRKRYGRLVCGERLLPVVLESPFAGDEIAAVTNTCGWDDCGSG